MDLQPDRELRRAWREAAMEACAARRPFSDRATQRRVVPWDAYPNPMILARRRSKERA